MRKNQVNDVERIEVEKIRVKIKDLITDFVTLLMAPSNEPRTTRAFRLGYELARQIFGPLRSER